MGQGSKIVALSEHSFGVFPERVCPRSRRDLLGHMWPRCSEKFEAWSLDRPNLTSSCIYRPNHIQILHLAPSPPAGSLYSLAASSGFFHSSVDVGGERAIPSQWCPSPLSPSCTVVLLVSSTSLWTRLHFFFRSPSLWVRVRLHGEKKLCKGSSSQLFSRLPIAPGLTRFCILFANLPQFEGVCLPSCSNFQKFAVLL